MNMKPVLAGILGVALLVSTPSVAAERYVIDTRGQHAFIQFRIPHLGFSWLYGRFNAFEGEFSFDADNPENSSVSVSVQTPSIDTNHGRRDEHLRNDDFLTVAEFPTAAFESTSFTPLGGGKYRLLGDLSLMGRIREVEIDVVEIGAGKDPWGGYRRGFEGTTSLTLADWGITYDLGPEARQVELTLAIEGIRQD